MDAPEVPGPKIKAGKTAVPVIAAIGIPALAFVGYKWWKHRHAGTSIVSGQPTAASSALDGSVGGVSAGSDPSGLMTIGAGGIAPGSISGVGAMPTAGIGLTLDAWGQAAENYLIGVGVSPLDAISAVNAYEGGQAMAPGAVALINEALGNLGAPPFAPTSTPISADPPLPTETAPPTETTPISPSSVPTAPPQLVPPPQIIAKPQPVWTAPATGNDLPPAAPPAGTPVYSTTGTSFLEAPGQPGGLNTETLLPGGGYELTPPGWRYDPSLGYSVPA